MIHEINSIMKILFKHTRIYTFLLTLLLLCGVENQAWAKVKYHILTLPFDVANWNGSNKEWRNNIRVEALLCESDETTIGLPDQFKSPLATGFRYWASATSTYASLYDKGNGTKIIDVKYNIYQCGTDESVENWKYACLSNELTAGTGVGSYTDIYVTYDYKGNGAENNILKLDGGTEYNIGFMNGNVEKFMCFNRSRNNRVANANSAGLSGEDLANDDFVVPQDGTAADQLGWKYSKWGPIGIFAGFKFTGNDPYNITILTSYNGKEIHITDKISNVDNNGTIKPYAGSSLMAKIGAGSLWFDASNNKHYKIISYCSSASDYNPEKYKEKYDLYWSTPEEDRAEDWVGFYRYESPTLSTFALLPNNTKGGYMFVGSKLNQNGKQEQPSGGNYYSYLDNYDNESGVGRRSQPYFKLQSLNSAYRTDLYEIRKYTIHIKTHISNTELTVPAMRWSDARLDENPANHVPEALKRKYCNYKAYKDKDLEQPITTFREILEEGKDNLDIYLDYTVSAESMPFETLPAGGDADSYKNARWYTMRMDGVANPKYVAYNDGSNNVVVTNESGAAKGDNTPSKVHQGENSAEAMVAFMGDPYELKILNRKACETATTNRFIGCATGSTVETTGLTTDKTGSSDISTWEIVYESTGETGMLLRQFNTAATPKYIGLGDAPSNKPVTYSATSSRIRVVELDKKKYAFHIMRDDESIAVMATSSEEVGRALKNGGDYTDIPEIIRSPYLSSATVNFYATQTDAEDNINKITNLPYDGSDTGTYAHVWVRYSFASAPSVATYNVRVNSDYIYTSGEAIGSKTSITDTERGYGEYQWTFDFSDPYALTIHNAGNGKYMKVSSWGDNANIEWSSNVADASLFIAKSGALPNTREVMAATGDATDASTTYYNIGRPSDNTVKLYSNSSYLSGNAILRFQLSATGASEVIYHLVDMYNNVLLDATTRQALTENPAFPPEYYSPLVNKYYYHTSLAHAKANRTSGDIADDAQINQTNIWVTYDVNDLVDLKAGQLYLMKYEAGETFHQEDGSDGVNPDAQKAVYPYVNGDGNFFVYGQEQYELQQQGASSTRTRWAWYVESNVPGAPKGDPYHITIKSRQTESYPITNSSEYNAYFMTYKPDGYSEVITTLGWPGMNSETATEYMVLGSEGQYQLVTTNTIPIDKNSDGDTEDAEENVRYVVDSFEQYWKTYDTIRRKLLKQKKEDYPDADDDKILVQSTPCLVTGFTDNREYLTTSTKDSPAGLGFHSYEKWAYAKRWNGYNNGYSSETGKHETKKGWEKVEHWYQTVNMGQGYFDFVKTSIDPVLILLDQHGWEIMRKPLPSSPDDPQKELKYAAIRPYNSPMVKEYAFWATAKKRSGLHQYYLMSDRIGGDNFTSTDLTNLPPYGSKNVLDKKGNLNDQYVTYIVKDEYAQTYKPADKSAKPFLIEQGINHKYATTNEGGTTLTASDIPYPYTGDMKAYILNRDITPTEKWFVKPNADIDFEMGYNEVERTWTKKKSDGNWDNKNPNAYEHKDYKDNLVARYISEPKLLTDSLGFFSFSNGFDPYNIQIESVQASARFMKTNANGAGLHEGSIIGEYTAIPGTVAMGDTTTIIDPKPKWYDSRNVSVTNATFMAVQDAAGNMQLMPRFDHATRMSEFDELIAPTSADVATTYTKLYRPVVYKYLIIDNEGHESLRYKSGGDMTPQIPDHFRSPLATNFGYYATATKTGDVYSNLKDSIGGALDAATLDANNTIYVRYEYDEEADEFLKILKGNWLTMQLNVKNAIYNDGIKQGTSKPATITSQKAWQWKFLETPQSTPDPYALYIFNRSQAGTKQAGEKRFAFLSHSAGDYALAEAGLGTYTYQFLNGSGMDETHDATIAVESGFKPAVGTFDGTKSQVILTDEVQHTFTYKVYTNAGVHAIDANQTQESVHSNDWKPVLPGAARTPLLNMDQYRYYEQDLSVATPDTTGKSLTNLYGLYDDVVYTRYTAYKPDLSNYLVPNVRNATSETTVAPGLGSNDAPVGLDGKRPYNIIWYNDNMMQSNGTIITSAADQELSANDVNEWEFEGDDPYAIKIKNVHESTNTVNKYIHEKSSTTTELSTDATPFMLLNKDGYNYGVFTKTGSAVTGATPVMLSGYGNALTTEAPTQFIPFALSTYKVIYHLMIKNIDSKIGVVIPYRGTETGNVVKPYRIKWGTTLRDLTAQNSASGAIPGDYYQLGASLKALQTETSGLFQRDSIYCVDAGHVSLGDAFEVPQQFYRPNVSYDFYIEGVYSADGKSEIAAMNSEYKGLKMTNLGEDSGLLGNIVFVNIVYNFMGGLDTNSGSDFVKSVADNKWYTFETNDVTPMLAEYSSSLQTKSGYATHYTNDYLWTPVGDPYGFKMYNRYLHKNVGGTAQVMSTENRTSTTDIAMVDEDTDNKDLSANSVYELLATSSTTPGYFRIHPVANMKDVTQVYMKNVVSAGTGVIKLSTDPTDWTFGLSEDVMKPYYQAAGYIGGLNSAGKAAYDVEAAKTNPLERLMGLQDVVYNHDNNPGKVNYIVHYAPGYYRLHNQPGSLGITTPRYASGYTHAIERDVNGDSNEADAIPLHFYEVEEYDINKPTFRDIGTAGNDYTESPATRGDIPLVTVANDPASIFYFYQGTAADPTTKIQTQGLFVKGNKMTKTESSATPFKIIDIGAGVVALQNGDNYLEYSQTSDAKYDLKFASDNTESARWCMKPVQKDATAKDGEMPLTVVTKSGGDDYYYTTFYAPFDALLTSTNDVAYIVPENEWPAMTAGQEYVMQPKKIGTVNTGTYVNNDQFIPAGTPVIIRTKNTGGNVTMVLPNATPSSAIPTNLSGENLEQMLTQDADDLLYVFGRSYTHSNEFKYDDPSSGVVIPAGLEFDSGVGFYKNANTDRESSPTKTMWSRNNKYVYANKVYYRGGFTAPAKAAEFIPLIFDFDEDMEEEEEMKAKPQTVDVSDDKVYDLQGRCIAIGEEVLDGSWKNNVAPGLYIIGGKKVYVGK